MKTTLTFAALVPALFAGSIAFAQDDDAAFGERVRQYLLENPQVIMEAVALLEQREAEAQTAADGDLIADNADALFDDGVSWVGGNPDGDVTVVEFLDYRCGYCRRAHPEVAELVASDGNIRLIVKEFPILGEQSVLASRFAVATLRQAGDAAYEQVNDALMTMRGDMTADSLEALGEELDIDTQAIMQDMDSDEVTAILAQNRALGQAMAINGTPSFVFGDQMVRGYVPLDAMREIVEETRAEG
ncbi:thioredoxin domain-containing protein [Maribius pontilimi]|uniref:Thioredoxin domain-containing protein n=1 Tax=Palleronia pontilimi TaxID=1964209 RepID=A0A934M8T8_9RHOB|nr:DsbA family protein [Palleronia pontilimi]MBJ3761777.1 thioredoxin domain-containing protein [Palleronia pontilimi]